MPTIKGFSTKDPNVFQKLAEATKGAFKLPFKATNWRSTKNANMVEKEEATIINEEKAVFVNEEDNKELNNEIIEKTSLKKVKKLGKNKK